MSANHQIVMKIFAAHGRSPYMLVMGLSCGQRSQMKTLGMVGCGGGCSVANCGAALRHWALEGRGDL